MTYSEAIGYLESFINYEKIDSYSYNSAFCLERMQELLELLGNPETKFNSIHIAGTKGKGSTSALVFSVLDRAGLRAGLYTSPHLSCFRERIRIAEDKSWRLISEEEVISLTEYIKPRLESFKPIPSFFEVYTALAFLYFARMSVEIAVVEVGMGGRLDATNVLKPLVCGITSISLEHTKKLGNTLTKITREKCGIIKPYSFVVSACQVQEVSSVIRNVCAEKEAVLYEVGKDIFFEEINFSSDKEIFSVKGILGEYPFMEIPLIGGHQLVNAALAAGIIDILRNYEIYIAPEVVREGFRCVYWPGRLEKIGKRPLIVLDGAQNGASAHALKEAVKKHFKYARLILVLGISRDKDIPGIIEELVEIADEVILTKADSPRAAEPRDIRYQIENIKYKNQIILTENTKEAVGLARKEAKEEDLILVTGSLFLVGEAREILIKVI